MIELEVVMLTIGAVLYHSLHVPPGTVVFIGVLITISLSLVLRTRKGIVFGLIMGSTLVLGALTLWQASTETPRELYGNRAFQLHVVSVDRRLDKTNIVGVESDYQQKIQVTTMERVPVLPGDSVGVRGLVKRPEDFTTDNGRIFGYRAYLESKGIVGLVSNALLSPVTMHHFSIGRFPTRVRYMVADVFAQYVAFPFDGVLAGMLVGYQGGLPSSIQDLFRNTGVLHVLVLSGYNITLLAGFVALLLKGVPFRVRSVITITMIILLVLVSGAGVASVRAGIMGSIALFSGLMIRTYQPLRALALAYLFFFFVSPMAIFVDPGFHLSFLATLFMIVVLPKVEQVFLFIPKTRHIDLRELIVLACTVPIFMLPYMMYFSGVFPLASPVANMLFAVITPILMIGGTLLVVLSWLTPLATVMGSVLSWGGTMILWVLRFFSTFPLWNTPALSGGGVLGIYVIVLVWLFRKELYEYLIARYSSLRQRTN